MGRLGHGNRGGGRGRAWVGVGVRVGDRVGVGGRVSVSDRVSVSVSVSDRDRDREQEHVHGGNWGSLGLPMVAPCSVSSRTTRGSASPLQEQRCSAALRPLRILDDTSARRCGRVASREPWGEGRMIMLRIYDVILAVLTELRPVIVAIEVCDRDLGRQLRRAATSMALNCAEGGGSHGGTRRERYRNALGSARESGACLDAAMALGYVAAVDAGLLGKLDHVRAVLAKNVR
ncbi:MAG TPA: four helix bundle protein [Polyangiaceae bacterium]|jgi:four helix bundle protein